jgi:prepilin-type N-terminal cleavage/methylation domain-containing protein
MKDMWRKEKGFTLMELMVVIVIVAILAAVAVPLYINYVKDAQRTEAKGAIGAIVTAQQVYYQANGEFAPDTSGLNVDLTDIGSKWLISIDDVDPGPPATFTVNAQGQDNNAGLEVTCIYTRGAPPQWIEK